MAHMNYIAYNPLTVMELASEQDRPRLEATQSKLKGFEIYKATEWSEFNDM